MYKGYLNHEPYTVKGNFISSISTRSKKNHQFFSDKKIMLHISKKLLWYFAIFSLFGHFFLWVCIELSQ